MKTILKSLFTLILTILLTSNFNTYSQVGELGNMLAGGTEDAQKLLQPYVTPAVNAFGAALAGGWYNTAEPHKLGGFDITFTTSAAIVPQKYRTYTIDDSELNYLKLGSGENPETQTISGEGIGGPQIVYNFSGFQSPAFRMPEGINTRIVPAPMIQAGVGLIKGTDVMFRYLPNIKYKENELGLWGIGGRHDLKQWIPGVKRIPVLKLSLMYGYTKLHTFVDMDINPGTIGAGSLNVEGSNTWDDQYMKIWVKSHTLNLLIAADLKVVTFYGGIGFVTTETNLKMEGEFPTVTLDETLQPVVVAINDPLDMRIKNQDGSITKPRFNAGMRFKLAIVTLHFDYSWANYSVLSAGLGFSFR
ncbi:MAG TPA: DUF6588 family protein [Bacteroidales bacterium]|nr:DUF6588 family protein [Bacteroidales bacterium]